MKKAIATCLIVLFGISYSQAGTWTTFDYPGVSSTLGTSPVGVSGNNIVGAYYYSSQSSFSQGFLHNTATQSWTTLDYPGARQTMACGISGNSIVGAFTDSSDHGFLYNMTTQSWTTLDYPGADCTFANGISGNSIVGYFSGIGNYNAGGFIYDIANQSWTTLNYPGASFTVAYGISGNNIVGQYDCGGDPKQGFLYNMTTESWTTLPILGRSIDGSNVVGENQLYNLTTASLITINCPGWASGISGNSIVGQYIDNSGNRHGFLYAVPEPATLLLLGLGGVLLRKW